MKVAILLNIIKYLRNTLGAGIVPFCRLSMPSFLLWTPYTFLSDKLWTSYTYLSDKLRTSYTYLSDKLRTSYTKLSDKLWTPYTYFSDNRHEDFEVNVKNEGENEVFHSFYHAHRDREVFLHHICRDKFSLDNPFKLRSSSFNKPKSS